MNRPWAALLGVVLLALTVFAYLPVWDNDFIDFDDALYITNNPRILNGLTASGMWWAWTNDDAPYWTPITWLSLQLDAQFFSTHSPHGETILCPAAFHGQNLMWHAGSVLLLFGLWRRLTGLLRPSFLLAALFAVHPMHVESVAWAIERKDVLSVFFGVLTLWAYVRYLENPGWRRYLALCAVFLLSLLSKPMLITLPFVLLLLDWWPLRRLVFFRSESGTGGPALRRTLFGGLLWEKMPLFALAAMTAAVTMAARDRHGALVDFNDISLSDRLANALAGYGWYVSSTLWPWPLAVLYPHPHDNWSPLRVLAGALCLVLVTAFAYRQARRRPWLFTGWLWFVLALLPVIGLAQGGAQAWADRFSYWPHIGLFVAMVWELERVLERLPMPPAIPKAILAIVLGVLTRLTQAQVSYWRDGVTLWEHAVAVTEDNDKAREHLAICYRKQGRFAEADYQLKETYRIQQKRRNAPAR